MALELPTLLQRYQLDSSGAVAGSRAGVGALSTLGGAFRSIRGLIEGAGIALGTFKVGSFLKESIQEASATQQSVKTVTALFGASAKEILDWGESNAAAFGIAKGPALQYAQQLGGVLKGFGFIPKAAADMSLSLEKVAGDVAIFRHQDPSQVIAAFRAGLYGASRGLRQYGIDTSAVAVHQAALSLGITSATKDWDAQTKAQVYYALIMRGTTSQVGTAAKRQHDLAVETAVLRAQISNLRDRIGTALLPIMAAFIGLIIRDAIPALETFAGWITRAGSWVWDKFAQPISRAFLLVRLGVAEFIAGFTHPTANLDPFGWVGHSVIGAGQIVRRTLNAIVADIRAFVTGLRGGDINQFGDTWQKLFARVGKVVHDVVGDIERVWARVSPVLTPVFHAIRDFLDSSAGKSAAAAAGFTVLGVSLAGIVGSPILSGLAGLSNVLGFVLDAIVSIDLATAGWVLAIGVMVGAIIYFYKNSQTFRDTLHNIVQLFEKEVVPRIKIAAGVIRDDLVAAFQYVRDELRRIGPPLLAIALAVGGFLTKAFRGFINFIKDDFIPTMHKAPLALIALAAPFGWIGLGLVYLYERFKRFHDIVDTVVKFVATAAIAGFRLLRQEAEKVGPSLERGLVAGIHGAIIGIGALIIAGQATVAWFRKEWPTISATAQRVGHDLAVGFGIAEGIFKAIVDFTQSYLIPTFEQIAAIVDQLVHGVVIPLLHEMYKVWQSVTKQIVTFVKEHWTEIRTIIKAVMVVVGAIIEVVLKVALLLWHTFGKEIISFTKVAFKTIGAIIKDSLTIVLGIIGIVLDLLTFHWGKAWHDLGKVVSAALDLVRALVVEKLKLVGELARAALAALGAIFRGAWTLIKVAAKGAFDAIVGFVRDLPGRLVAFVAAVGLAGLAIGAAIIRGITSGLSGAGGLALTIAEAIANAGIALVNVILKNLHDGIINLANVLADINIPGAGKAFDAASSALRGIAGHIGQIQPIHHGGGATNDKRGGRTFASGGIVPGSGAIPIIAHGGEGVLKSSTVRSLAQDLFGAVGSVASQHQADEAAGDSVVFENVTVYPQEHALTPRGLMTEMRKVERHGTLQAHTGVPRKQLGVGRRP